MITYSFIGSDKNAGKTTTFKFVYQKVFEKLKNQKKRVCLCSIGINGEKIDCYEDVPKPEINILTDSYFITEENHLKKRLGHFQTFHIFPSTKFGKNYVLARSLISFPCVLEGPNNRNDILMIKKFLEKKQFDFLFIDGSIDRQFLASPDITDSFFFSVLITERKEQQRKLQDFFTSLNFKKASDELINQLTISNFTKSQVILNNSILYEGKEIALFDEMLKEHLLANSEFEMTLYLDGALSKSLYDFLAPFKRLTIILNNFTQFQSINVKEIVAQKFYPQIFVLHEIRIGGLFINQKVNDIIPGMKNIPSFNLFRENINDIRI